MCVVRPFFCESEVYLWYERQRRERKQSSLSLQLRDFSSTSIR